ncbi:hypothetical protein [Amphibacillus indicireducens]|uniref:Uncharacterized protein n=1 Tax=Amphibacillus indicireducens TaxID=1076330 RepID=A0ABP7VUJ2_9BACI
MIFGNWGGTLLKYHKTLMLSNKNKYAALIIMLVVSTFITISATQSFIAEDTSLPTLFIISVLQVLFFIQYLLIRLLYRGELLVLNQDSIHLFVIGKRAKRKVLLNKKELAKQYGIKCYTTFIEIIIY